MIDFMLFGGFDFRLTDERTFVLLESLSRLKIRYMAKILMIKYFEKVRSFYER